MTAPNINLTQLREHAQMLDPIYNTPLTWVKLPPDQLLALIDTAEAAIEAADAIDYLAIYPEGAVGVEELVEANRRLRETLTPYTT